MITFKNLLKMLDEKGYEWSSGGKLTTGTHYKTYKENTCYDFGLDNRACYSPLVLYQKKGYTIVEFEDIDFKEEVNNMITFKDLLERAKSEKIVVHTPTEKQAKALLKALDKRGFTWLSGEKLTTKTLYEIYGKDICYNFGSGNKVSFFSLPFHQKYGYAIIEFSDINFTDKPSKTTPKSDIKTIYQSEDKLTTCVVFIDGTKVKVKKHKGDKGSIYTAVAYAITKKTYGSNKVFTEIVDEKLYKGGK